MVTRVRFLAPPASVHPAISNAKLSWAPTPREMIPMLARPRAAKSLVHHPSLVRMYVILCNKTSLMGLPVKEEELVPMANVQDLVLAKKSRAGYSLIKHWSLRWHQSSEDCSSWGSYRVVGVGIEDERISRDGRHQSVLLPLYGQANGYHHGRRQLCRGRGELKTPAMATGRMDAGSNLLCKCGLLGPAFDMLNDGDGIHGVGVIFREALFQASFKGYKNWIKRDAIAIARGVYIHPGAMYFTNRAWTLDGLDGLDIRRFSLLDL